MQLNNIEDRIFRALDKLAHSCEDLLHVLAERMVWDGGMEKLFQGVFLWAFNSLEQRPYYYMAPELNDVDFMVFESDPVTDHLVEQVHDRKDERWYGIACSYIEVKDIVNIRDVPRDLGKLKLAGQKARRDKVQSRFLYEMILLKDWKWEKSSPGWQQKLERDCWRELKRQGVNEDVCRIGSKLLFEDKQPSSSSSIHTYLEVLLIAVPVSPAL